MGLKVLITDYAWPTLDIERNILGMVGAELLIAQSGEEAELVKLASAAHAILTNLRNVTSAVLNASPLCRIVARYGIGLDNIAVEHATRLGIMVTNVPNSSLDELSDHAMALLLASVRGITRFAHATRQGVWDLSHGQPLGRLRGKTLGLIGYGNTAQSLIPKALSFGLEIIAYAPQAAFGEMTSFGSVTNNLDYVLSESDFVSIHLPLTPETRGLINARTLKLMKQTAYLINTSHGAIVDEPDLYQALCQHRIAGAALDSLGVEPPEPDNPLLKLDNVIVTPRAAYYSAEVVESLEQQAANQVVQVLCNRVPSNIVNPQVIEQTNFRLERNCRHRTASRALW